MRIVTFLTRDKLISKIAERHVQGNDTNELKAEADRIARDIGASAVRNWRPVLFANPECPGRCADFAYDIVVSHYCWRSNDHVDTVVATICAYFDLQSV